MMFASYINQILISFWKKLNWMDIKILTSLTNKTVRMDHFTKLILIFRHWIFFYKIILKHVYNKDRSASGCVFLTRIDFTNLKVVVGNCFDFMTWTHDWLVWVHVAFIIINMLSDQLIKFLNWLIIDQARHVACDEIIFCYLHVI